MDEIPHTIVLMISLSITPVLGCGQRSRQCEALPAIVPDNIALEWSRDWLPRPPARPLSRPLGEPGVCSSSALLQPVCDSSRLTRRSQID